MAGRRVRIKGIANIPVRRKNDTQSDVTEKTPEEPIITETISDKSSEVVQIPKEIPPPVEKITETPKNDTTAPKSVHFENESWGSVNRARIRPVPRFVRRGSASASESEDDTRRSRVRTESLNDTSRENQINVPPPEKKQCRRLAAARREFQMKFGVENPPDRKKLTMMDLIFYNPVTNPMSAREEEEIADDPAINENVEEVEEEMAVPQVKVGPDGEIILDEQSLVVERTGERAALERLRTSRVVTENNSSSQGIGSRRKKRKEWSAKETIRFYRALHAAGTDFSLLTPLFPGRSRHEIKMKFKREERRNRVLIDRALTHPLKFDLTHLEEQLNDEEEIFQQLPPTTNTGKRKYYKSSAASREIDDKNENKPETKRKRTETNKPKENKPKSETYCNLRQGLDSLASSSEDEYVFPDSETLINEKSTTPRPTRICRLRNTSNYEKLLNSDNSDIESDNDSTTEPNLSPNEDDHPDIERIKLENKKAQMQTSRKKQRLEINTLDTLETSKQNENISQETIIENSNKNIQEKVEKNDKSKSEINENVKTTERVFRHHIKPKINLNKFRTQHKKDSLQGKTDNTKQINENDTIQKNNNDPVINIEPENCDSSENITELNITNKDIFGETEFCDNVNKITDNLLGQKASKELKNDINNLVINDLSVPDFEKLPEVEQDIETNIVIAHSENDKPDKILIDVVSRRVEADVQTKVSLKIEGAPENCGNSLEPGSLVIMGAGADFKVYMVTPDQGHVPVDLDANLVRSLLDTTQM